MACWISYSSPPFLEIYIRRLRWEHWKPPSLQEDEPELPSKHTGSEQMMNCFRLSWSHKMQRTGCGRFLRAKRSAVQHRLWASRSITFIINKYSKPPAMSVQDSLQKSPAMGTGDHQRGLGGISHHKPNFFAAPWHAERHNTPRLLCSWHIQIPISRRQWCPKSDRETSFTVIQIEFYEGFLFVQQN